MRSRPAIVLLALLGMFVTACGGGEDPSPAQAETGGWIDDEPAWDDEGSASAERGGMDYGATAPDAAPTEPPPPDRGKQGGALSAGSVDDNADYAAYLQYLRRIDGLGLRLRPFDARGRIVVTVAGADGRPAAGETVTVVSGSEEVATLRTTADGTARFLPGIFGQPVDGAFTVRAGDDSAEADAGSAVELTVDRPGGADAAVPLDVLFLLDATGSMGDEIDQLKTSIDSVAARVAALEGSPDVRFGMTLYRDRGDAFVTSTYDFTDDVEEFRAALAKVQAGGGGDYPEALEEGLAEALGKPSWRPAGEAVQLVFLVADAPPQTKRDLQVTYPDAVRDAVSRGIKIFPVASSESDDLAEGVFRQLAQATGARFVFLSYGAGGAATGKNTDIDKADYEELALDDLVVRLTAEEIAALTGDTDVVPDPTVPPETTETTPPGQ